MEILPGSTMSVLAFFASPGEKELEEARIGSVGDCRYRRDSDTVKKIRGWSRKMRS